MGDTADNAWIVFPEQPAAPAAQARAALEGSILCDLGASHSLIRVHGADARDFLHRQLTADLNALPAAASTLAAWCDPKGRVQVLFRVTSTHDGFLLRLPTALVAPTLQRLRLFVLRSRVELSEADDLGLAGIAGDEAAAALAKSLPALPEAPGQVLQADDVLLIRIPGPGPRFEIVAPPARLAALYDPLATVAQPVAASAWRLLDVIAGLPEVWPRTRGAFVPQMINLHWLGGVSFRKGCYPGQEIVARMHYLGKLKRRLFIARAAQANAAEPGDAVYADGASQTVGEVVTAAPHPDGGLLLTAVLRIDAASTDALRLGTPDGPTLELKDLPYSIDEPT